MKNVHELDNERLNRIKDEVAFPKKWKDFDGYQIVEYYPEVCRRYAEEYNQAGLKAESIFINKIADLEKQITELKSLNDKLNSQNDELYLEVKELKQKAKESLEPNREKIIESCRASLLNASITFNNAIVAGYNNSEINEKITDESNIVIIE